MANRLSRQAEIALLRLKLGICLMASLALALPAQAQPETFSDSKRITGGAAGVRKPKIGYPAEAKRAGMEGRGIVAMRLDSETGEVTAVWMAKSTGHAILDREAIRAFRDARVRPGSRSPVMIPVTFTIPKRAR